MHLLNGSQSAAAAAYICKAGAIIQSSEGAPFLPQLDLPKDYAPELLDLEGSAAVSAAIGRALAGKRTFISNGFHLRTAALHRVPVVATNPHRKNWSLVFAPETNQEILDDIIAAFAISENSKVLIPSTIIVSTLATETYEPVELPGVKIIENVIGRRQTSRSPAGERAFSFTPQKNHLALASDNLEAAAQLQKSLEAAHKEIQRFGEDWRKKFRRPFPMVAGFMLEDAEFAFVAYGPNASNAKLAVQRLREQGEPVGLIRLNVLRPLPEQELRSAFAHISRLAVVDNEIFLGSWSKLYHDIRHIYPGFISNFIYQDVVTVSQFVDIYKRLKSQEKPERVWMV